MAGQPVEIGHMTSTVYLLPNGQVQVRSQTHLTAILADKLTESQNKSLYIQRQEIEMKIGNWFATAWNFFQELRAAGRLEEPDEERLRKKLALYPNPPLNVPARPN